MKATSAFLSGVATVALLSGFVVATPALAQYSGNPPQYSSPAERAETQQLNEQNVGGTTESPAALNGEQVTAQGYGDYDQNQPPSDYQQQQYDQRMQQYQGQQEQYQSQRDRYDHERARYENNLRGYDQARWDYDYPRSYIEDYSSPRLERLNLIQDPRRELWNVPVEGRSGAWVGRIREVDRAVDGRIMRVEVALNRRVSVWLHPSDLRFDPDNGVAFTNLTRHDLWQMPGQVRAYPM